MPAMNDQKFAEFFAVMAGIFGHKWTSQYGENPENISARVWNDGLSELSLQQIAFAIRHYKNHNVTAIWPPSLPEFRSVALGIPTLGQIRFDIARKNKTPFTQLVWQKLDGYLLARADQRMADSMIREAYELALIAVVNGEPLPEPVELLDAPVKPEFKPANPETVAKFKAEIESII